MGAKLKQLREDYAKGLARAKALHAKADRVPEETRELMALVAKAGAAGEGPPGSLAAIKAEIAAEESAGEALAGEEGWARQPARGFPFAGAKGRGDGEGGDGGAIEAGDAAADKAKRTGGFKSMGHLAYTIARAAHGDFDAVKAVTCWRVAALWVGDDDPDEKKHRPQGEHVREAAVKALGGQAEEALKAAAGMGITADPTADVFVPMEFSNQIFKRTEGIESNLASKVRRLPIRGSLMRIPAWNDADRGAAYRAGGRAGLLGGGGRPPPTPARSTRRGTWSSAPRS
jgi:hypothetical protein